MVVMKMPRPMTALVTAVGLLTAVRVFVVMVSPLELYPDEAQYWLWSRHLAFGYFSKPPLIAWLIRATTAIGGQSEAAVRIAAPLLHGGAAIAMAFAGRRLYGPVAGAAAGAIYSLCPGVQLSSAVIATDAPLMLALSLALYAYAVWWTAKDGTEARLGAAGFGLALGAAFMAKYAAVYFVLGAVLHAASSEAARRRWRAPDLALAAALGLAVWAPNLLWNAAHHFQTVAHTAADANLSEDGRPARWFDPRGGLGFVIGQFGVFGPLPFAVFLAAGWAAWRSSAGPSGAEGRDEDRLLVAFAAPALLIVLVEAVVSRANANWAGAAYAPAAVLVGGVLARRGAARTFGAVLLSQGLMAAAFLTVFADPALGDRAGVSNSLKRARGWAASTASVAAAARAAQRTGPLTAIAVDDRFLFDALAYYGRDKANRPAAALPAPLTMWVREAKPHSQAEADAPLPEGAARVLIINANARFRPEIEADFTRLEGPPASLNVPLDAKHDRPLAVFIGDDYRRRPRDPKTGRPVKP
jgi:4-amino-4-deoxy-L-arabinose transferase-like glycosyltransferase